MFATVECRDAPGGMKTFFRDLFTLPEIEIIKVNVPFGDAFYRVVATEYRGQIPVKEVCQKLERLKGSVLFEVNFPCDEESYPLEYEAKALRPMLLFNSAVDYIKNLKLDALKSSVSLYDPDGIYVKKVESLASLFSKIRVYTKNTSAYKKASDEIMNSYGLSLIICDKITGRAPDSTVAICPEEVPFCDFFKGILFTDADDAPACGCCVRGDGIVLPGEYELLRPSGICKMHFASALYEKSKVKALGELSFEKLRLT